MNYQHETVLLHEAVDSLAVKPDGIYVDATLGGAGHSAYLLTKLESGHLYAFDQDETAHEHASIYLKEALDAGKVTLIKDNFRNLRQALATYDVAVFDGILYDLGVSSPQFDDSSRGFSYKLDARLDMRMDRAASLTAYEVVNTYSFHDLLRIFSRYGEEKFAKSIARKIEQQRQIQPIESTVELAELIKSALPQKELKKKGHPAKRIFQALRIEVNDELGAAAESFEQAIDMLKPQGRIAVISFHSLEDRLAKQIFKENSEIDIPRGLPEIPEALKPKLRLITRKPITANAEELAFNNRSHSAKLRVAEKTDLFHNPLSF